MDSELDSLSYSEWIRKYQPRMGDDHIPYSFDVVDDMDEIMTFPENCIWSEIWDESTEEPVITNGLISDEDGAIAWFVTQIPWSSEITVFEVPET